MCHFSAATGLRKTLALLLLSAVVSASAVLASAPPVMAQTVTSPNLIADPGFDDGNKYWAYKTTSGSIIADPSNPSNNIMRLVATSATSWSNAVVNVSSVITPGATYLLTGQGRLSATNVSGYMDVTVADAHWNALANPIVYVKTTSFATYQLQFTLPPTAKFVSVNVARGGGSTTSYADFDNISLTLVPPAACGTHASGTSYTLTTGTTTGSTTATVAQCPYGGTQPNTTTTTQNYSCTNGVQTAQGAPVSTTANTAAPICNAPAACGTTPSGATITQTISSITSTTTPTVAQCPYGGTQPVTTTVTQTELCTNGAFTNQGAPITTTTNNGNPTCTPAPLNGACGTSNGASLSSAPTTNLCTAGTASAVSGTGPWSWSCAGSSSGSTASCSASFAVVNGQCGAANGSVTSTAPATGLCTTGTPTALASNGPSYAPWSWSCTGSSGGSSTNCVALARPAFIVAPNGNDKNPGTLAQPFATLAKAQSAMRASTTVKITYLRAGSYRLPTIANCDLRFSCGLALNSSADNGETWSYYPPDGFDTADISGSDGGAGLYETVSVSGTSNVTINGVSIHDFEMAGIFSQGGTSNLLLENNLIFNGTDLPGTQNGSNPGAILCLGCSNATITHNVIHDIVSFGIAFLNVNGNISNLNVNGNVVYNTCTGYNDCGALYIVDGNGTATNLQWTNNYIRDGNTSGTSGYGSAMYADDCVSNLTASGNIVSGHSGSNTLHTHGGSNVHFVGNLIDLGTYQGHNAVYQTSGLSGCASALMSGNEFENNIVISAGGGGGFPLYSGKPQNVPTIKNNDYYNYAGTPISTTVGGPEQGAYADANPSNENPQLSGWAYAISSGSPVFSAPVSFPGIIGGWGPPGYTIPKTGSQPSSPK